MPVQSLSELDTQIQSIIATATGWPKIIKANQDAPAPSGEYGTYSVQPIRAYGQPRADMEDIPALAPVPSFEWQDMRQHTISAMDVMVSINFFGPNAQEAAMRMYNACHRPSIGDKLYAAQIAWRYCSESRDMTYIEQGTVERRFQIDWFIYVETESIDDIYKVASSGVSIKDENGNTLYSED